MMRIFLDTEFVETTSGLRFISAGMVTENGRELYAEAPLVEAKALLRRYPNDLVRREVIPQLGRIAGAPWTELSDRLAVWLNSLGVSEAEVVYDFSADYTLVEELIARLDSPLAVRLVPCHVGYLLDDADGQAAAAACWHAVGATRGIWRHHALADAFALSARFEVVHRPAQHIEPN